ncbi:MAG: hypothetical protein ACR2HK_10780 [Gemmatimonadales bacterium]
MRYRERLPDTALTPGGLKSALAEYVVFDSPNPRSGLAAGPAAGPLAPASMPATAGGLPRKGMLIREADVLLGAPKNIEERPEGRLKVVTRTYATKEGQIIAEFVEGVLFRYSAISN